MIQILIVQILPQALGESKLQKQKSVCPSSTVVEHSTYDPNIDYSNPTTGTGKSKLQKQKSVCPSSTVVEHSTYNQSIRSFLPLMLWERKWQRTEISVPQ
jgi:hypothetical protein